jgi:putative transposase
VPSRLSPTDKIRAEIDALFGSGRDLAEVLEDVARLGARLIMQTGLEVGVAGFLGRAATGAAGRRPRRGRARVTGSARAR